jgi:lipid-A-disaccharide synthase
VIFPFEVSWFSPYQAPVAFVGNPTVEEMARADLFSGPNKGHPGQKGFHIAIVPGSRRQEIEHMLPRMLDAFKVLQKRFSFLRATVSRYAALPEGLYRRYLSDESIPLVSGPLREILRHADCAMVTSGTATLETALLGIPHIVVYHTSAITYAVAKRLIAIPHIGLPNIIAGEEIIPECVQQRAEGAHCALTMERFIESPRLYETTMNRLIALRELLGEKKPSEELCKIIKKVGGW